MNQKFVRFILHPSSFFGRRAQVLDDVAVRIERPAHLGRRRGRRRGGNRPATLPRRRKPAGTSQRKRRGGRGKPNPSSNSSSSNAWIVGRTSGDSMRGNQLTNMSRVAEPTWWFASVKR